MAKISDPHRLYLYRLLSAEIGVGRQTMIGEVERVLVEDDVLPEDLGCETVRELMESLPEFVRVTVFKRGRVYATITQNPAYDELLADKPKEAPAPQKGGRRSWKQRKAARVVRPLKPRSKRRPVVEVSQESVADAQEKPADQPDVVAYVQEKPVDQPANQPTAVADAQVEPTPPEATLDEDIAAPEAPETASEAAPETSEATPDAETQDAPEPAEPTADGEQTTEPEDDASQETSASNAETATREKEDASATASAPEPAEQGAEDAAAKVAGDVASDAVSDELVESDELPEAPASEANEVTAGDVQAEPTPEHAATDVPQTAEEVQAPAAPDEPPAPPRQILPTHIASEVFCANEQLSALYSVLPFDVDPIELLDEDWQVARSTEDFEAGDGRLRYPLRYLRIDGSPVEVTLRRGVASPSGKRWTLEEVSVGDELDLWGLPAADEGAWSHLTDALRQPHELVSPRRELARFAHLGSWETLLTDLAELAEKEPWGESNEVLRDYLAVTFHRAQVQGRIVQQDGHAAFDTGLLSEQGESVCMHFDQTDEGRTFTHFSTSSEGLDLTPATYVATLGQLTLEEGASLTLARGLATAYGEELEEAARLGIVRALRNHRVATPAYDPQTDELRLLVPVRLADGMIRALVLAREGQASYLATALLPVEVAWACCRVVSAEQPLWLTNRG